MHDPSNNECPKNADPRNESCACGPEWRRYDHAGKFAVGDRIRGYDWPHRKDSYIEGVVTDPNGRMPSQPQATCYVVAIEKRMLLGEDHTIPNDTGFIPHRVFLGDTEGRIEKVEG